MQKYSLIHWLLVILLVWMSACQPSPPPTGQDALLPSTKIQSPSMNKNIQPKTPEQASRRNLLPQSTLSFDGQQLPKDAPESLKALFEEPGFQTQSTYPTTPNGGYKLSGVTEYEANLGISGPLEYPWQTITLDSPARKLEAVDHEYAGFQVLSYGRDEEGYSFASQVRIHHSLYRYEGGSRNPHISYSINHLIFESTDGQNFVYQKGPDEAAHWNYAYSYNHPMNGCTHKAIHGNGHFNISSAHLELDYERAEIKLALQMAHTTTVTGTLCSNYTERFNQTVTGSTSIRYTQKIKVEEEPSLEIEANPSTITEVGQVAKIKGHPSHLNQRWVVRVTTGTTPGCGQNLSQSAVGEQSINFPFTPTLLTNTIYTLTPHYSPSVTAQRNRFIPTTVTVNIPTTVTPNPAYLVLGQTTQLRVSVPPCPKWTLTLTGPLAGGNEGQTCTYTTAGTSSGNTPKNINWNGSCAGGTMGIGNAQGTLKFDGGHIPPVQFIVPIMSTVPTPTPSVTAPPPLPEDGTWAYFSDSRYCRKLTMVNGIQQCIDCIGQEVELVNGEPVGCKPKHETATEQRPFGIANEGDTPYSQTWLLRVCENPFTPSTTP